jgi:hypothetical protein
MNVDRQESDCLRQESAQLPSLLHSDSHCSSSTSHNAVCEDPLDCIKEGSSRREYRWSRGARDLVRSNITASGAELSALITRLLEESGNPRWACRRFVRRMGIKSKRLRRTWTIQEQQRLLKLIDLHPVKEVAKLMRRSQSSIWHMLYRLGANAKMGKDSFTKYTLAVALHIRPETIEGWIERGWLKAKEVELARGKRVIIEAEDFCEFCRKHTRDAVGHRLSQERLDFIYQFAFPPSHAALLPVRESLKERGAYDAQLNGKSADPRARLGPAGSYEEADALDHIA